MKKLLLIIIKYMFIICYGIFLLYLDKNYLHFHEWINKNSITFLLKFFIIGILPMGVFTYFWNKYVIK